MKKCFAIALVISVIFLGCSYENEKTTDEMYGNSRLEICEDINTSIFSDENILFINKKNFNEFCGLWEQNPELVKMFLDKGGKLVVEAQGEMPQVVEEKLSISLYREETLNIDTKCLGIIFYELDDKMCCREIWYEKNLNYTDKEIIQRAAGKIQGELYSRIEVNGPEYIGTEGYIYVGKDLLLNIKHDLFTMQDQEGYDTYFVIANVELDTIKPNVKIEMSLTSPTSSMTWIAAEPGCITPENDEEVKLMAGFESIEWKYDAESFEIESYTMPQGELWKVVTADSSVNFKLGLVLDCPMSKADVKFSSKIQFVEDDSTRVIEDIFSYTVNE